MKYRCFKLQKKQNGRGGDYWRDVDILEHLELTAYQTSYNYVLRTFRPPIAVLEAGCGLGRWAIALSQKQYQVTGIEIEREAVDIIKQHYSSENLNIVQGDILDMPFPDHYFDLVLSLGVLEHFEDIGVQGKAITEHLRVLKNEGVFLVTVPYFSLIRLILHLPYTWLLTIVRKLKGKEQHFSEFRYGLNAFKSILVRNHLRVIDVIWDDLLPPYSFGLTIDCPLKRITRSGDGVQYKLNAVGRVIHKILWNVHPALVSGGIGFVCKKRMPFKEAPLT